MSWPQTPHNPSEQPPFLLLHEHLEVQPNGNFRPTAYVAFDASFRASTLLTALSAEELWLLLAVLSFITPNGHIQPLLLQIAEVLKLSPLKTSLSLNRLMNRKWRDQPLLWVSNIGGQPAFAPSPHLFQTRTLAPLPSAGNESNAPPTTLAREQVIAHSRARYARPRLEVERQIARLNGWPEPPFDIPTPLSVTPPVMNSTPVPISEQRIVRGQLLRVGLDEDQADSLLTRFDLIRIRRQLSWLPYHRGVRNRAGFLIAAITDDYEAPLALRINRSVRAPDEPEEKNALDEDLPVFDNSQI